MRILPLMLVSRVAAASPSPFSGPDIENKTFVLAGLNVGAVSDDRGKGVLGGFEVSVAHFATAGWYGAYVDGLIDDHRARGGVGGEAGLSALGIDAGFVFDRDGVGVRIRGVVTAGVVSLCVGPVIPLTGGNDWIEASVLVKWPFGL